MSEQYPSTSARRQRDPHEAARSVDPSHGGKGAFARMSPQALAALGIGTGSDSARRARTSDSASLTGAIPVVESGEGMRARVRRKVNRLSRRWQRSLGLRVTVTTMLALALAFAVLMLVVTWQIRDRFYDERVDDILMDAAFLTAGAQETFDASTATTSGEFQRLTRNEVLNAVGGTAGPSGAAIVSASEASCPPFSEPTTSIQMRELLTTEMRQRVQGDQQYWQAVALPRVGGGTSPGIMVGQMVALPEQCRMQFYLVYSMGAEERTISLVLQVLSVAVAAFILVVGLIMTGVVRTVLRPVRQAALSAERLADGLLDERMEVQGRDEIARLGRSFNEMAASLQHQIERLGALSVLQQRFVSDVSHELRTPLTTVKMAADMIYEGREEFPPQLRRSAELLQAQIDRFDAMLADLLEISRIDAGAAVLDLDEHDLRDIANRVAELTQMLADNKGSDLVVEQTEIPVVAECDARRIERVIRNLVVNAIEHSEGRPVVITLSASSDSVGVRVRDHGVGMTPEDASRVFDRFWRADPARARTTGGTGLGLTISQEDTRLHGGTITATGRVGEGASFLVLLPKTAGATITDPALDLGELAGPKPSAQEPGDVQPLGDVAGTLDRSETSEQEPAQANAPAGPSDDDDVRDALVASGVELEGDSDRIVVNPGHDESGPLLPRRNPASEAEL